MIRLPVNFVRESVNLSWLTGPIFGKELRVSSRRRRNYVLRFAYLALLTIFLVLFWLEEVRYGGSAVNRASRMGEAGMNITAFIVWFQFIAAQLVAIVMMSNSISDEIYNRTLGLLMTTPINSLQIVMGKLLSKLLQLILLLAITLPLLAIVRVFGGVPWAYVVSSLCIILTTAVFVGSVSMLFSIFSRRAYAVIILTVLTLAFLFAALPFLSGLFWHLVTGDWPEDKLTELIFYPNPYAVLGVNTGRMLSPRGIGGPTFYWPVHCAMIMAASAALMSFCVSRVRKVALRQAAGAPSDAGRTGKKVSPRHLARKAARPARRVNGPPTLWKELRTPILRRHKLAAFVVISIALGLLFLTYLSLEAQNDLNDDDVQIVYVIIFVSAAMLFNVVLPATAITSEKESRSWPLLLATTLDDGQILFGKFAGVVRRCLPAWALLFGHLILFSFIGYIRPIAILQMAILAAWVIAFLTCTGLYFSARFKRTTTAVIMNFALVGFLWVLMPFLLLIIGEITRSGGDLAEFYLNTNPLVQAVVIGRAACPPFDYYWPGTHARQCWVNQPFGATCWMLLWMLCYIMTGLLFAWFAKRRFRRNIF